MPPVYKTPESLISGAEKISSVPLVYARLTEVLNSPHSSVHQISSIISQDIGLSVRLLRIVNSAYFGFSRKIDTISQAVIVVGTQQLRDLALATSVLKVFNKIPEHFVTMESFWKHSIGTGIAARALAGFCRETNVERHFVAGLLHDVGRLIIYDRIPDTAVEIIMKVDETGEEMYRVEQTILGYDHGAVGSALIKAWRLPSGFEEVIMFHHKPMLSARYQRDTAILHLADAVSHAFEFGSSGNYSIPGVSEEAWNLLGIPLDVLSHLFEAVNRQSNEVFDKFLSLMDEE